MPDKYDREARYVPALVSTIPFVFLWFYYLKDLDGAFWQTTAAVTVGSIGLTSALFLVMVQFCRAIGKIVEEKLFKQGLYFPTTEFLLDTDSNLSTVRRAKILAKVGAKFGIDLTDKTEDTVANRREIHEAVGQIRSMFFKKNDMILQRNIQFGMSKNLFGGSILAVVVSVLGVLVSHGAALRISLVLLGGYLLLSVSSFLLIRFTAKHFAHTLYDEFLAS